MANQERTELLLALILSELMKEAPQYEKIDKLQTAGFSNVEIADILGIGANTVAQTIYEARKSGTKRKKLKKPSGK